ncbi:MAG TPA: hypothetical protein VFN61_03050, partial [Acidimicrobiales bacterium]|nr:hypothetical protein [Acidimicrobiales bacterium]
MPGEGDAGGRWSGPTWGQPSEASGARVPLRALGTASGAAVRADGGFCEWAGVLAATVAGVSHRLKGR